MEPHQLAKDIELVTNAAYAQLMELNEDDVRRHPTSNGWSVKEIIGHLIDSASNNHQRWVRLQIADNLTFPDYGEDNERWVRIQQYEAQAWTSLLGLWRQFNLHLSTVVRHVNEACLENRWVVGEDKAFTLSELMIDYLEHMKEHLEQIRNELDRKGSV